MPKSVPATATPTARRTQLPACGQSAGPPGGRVQRPWRAVSSRRTSLQDCAQPTHAPGIRLAYKSAVDTEWRSNPVGRSYPVAAVQLVAVVSQGRQLPASSDQLMTVAETGRAALGVKERCGILRAVALALSANAANSGAEALVPPAWIHPLDAAYIADLVCGSASLRRRCLPVSLHMRCRRSWGRTPGMAAPGCVDRRLPHHPRSPSLCCADRDVRAFS
jgi:hypothetical protein